jgi:hypothetical protein
VKRRFSLATVAAGLALAAAVAVGAEPAGSASVSAAAPRPQQSVENRAAVVVDTGSGVRYGCVRFSSDTISGKQALEQAAMDPVFQEFGGNLGSAVCSLCGTGCPVGSCLTCASQVWSYWRQGAGSGGYSFSSVGVSSTVVHDGDVEGWVWGRSGPPPGITVENVCGPKEPPPAPPPPPPPAPGSPGADPTASGGATPGGDGTGAAPGADPAAHDSKPAAGGDEVAAEGGDGASADGKAGNKKKDDGNERNADGELTAATSDDSGGGGGPPASLLGLLALLAVLGGAAYWFHRTRNRPAPG